MHYNIRQATVEDAPVIGRMAWEMECELWPDASPAPDMEAYQRATIKLLSGNQFWSIVATDQNDEIVAMLTLNECMAIYAEGCFGEIMEAYVKPALRSSGLGRQLIDAAAIFAQEKNWPFIEVGAPAQPVWQRTLNFYKRQGFKEIGPRLELSVNVL